MARQADLWHSRPGTGWRGTASNEHEWAEYWFGTGDGTTHTWFSEPDLALGGDDFDAVALDFDGDGLVDDAMWDRDRDGVVDMAVLDRDTAPQHYADPSRRGVWDVALE